MIKQQDIEKVLDACNIYEIVNSEVPLKTAGGARYKACCPFHTEKTPSFTVFKDKGTYKCFGCGEYGNSVDFLMKYKGLSFPEAIKELADKYGIKIEERPLTAKEMEEQKLREAMYIANGFMAKEYHQQLLANKGAQAYAYKRWGKEYCAEMCIGYCPLNAHLVDKVGISPEIAEKLHLKNKGGFDFLGGRITIPIRDRMNRIIGFTARLFDDFQINGSSPGKYMNSTESLIYEKSKSLFGINFGWREGLKQGKFYLVEGAPDCMRLQIIGILNTLAPLGTAWTDEQFLKMKSAVKHLCFVPDADPPKEGEKFGPGTIAVMKSGEAAMRLGFEVSVKQIPIEDKKQDPDTYFTDKNKFASVDEVDFVLWLADLLFEVGMNTAQHGNIVARLSSLLALIENDTTVEMYIGQLTRYIGNRSLWKKEVDKQRKMAVEEEEKAKIAKDEALYKKYGFNMVEGKYYYSISENGSFYEWSNFTMNALVHVIDGFFSSRVFELVNASGVKNLIEMKPEDLVSLAKFKQKVESLGNYIWKASEKELTKLKEFLFFKTETANRITQLGWQRQGFYAFGNGIFYDGTFHNVDEYGLVHLKGKGSFFLPALSKIYIDDYKLFQFERRFIHTDESNIKLRQFTDQLFLVYGDNGRIGFLFYLATLFRDVVTRSTRSFPILNLFGPKGSGKSELGHTLMAFFISNNIPPNIQNSTLPALNDTVASVANALVHLDEYKNNLDINKHEFLKGLWDGTGRTRINLDDKKKETTSVDSGIILSGQEMPTADIALFSRLIFLSFSKSSFSEEEKKKYLELRKMRSNGLTHLTLEILKLRKTVEDDFPVLYEKTMMEVNAKFEEKEKVIEDRILMNWVSPLAVFRCLESYLDTELSFKQMMKLCVEGIEFQNAQCRQNNELANFWNMVQYLVSEGEIIEGGDYRIVYLHRLKTNSTDQTWKEEKPILYIQKTRLFMLYKKHGKAVGDTLLPEASLKYYLEHSREYYGEKNGIRYTVYHHGVIQLQKGGTPGAEASVVQRSYCFDYNVLVEKYNINLERAPEDVEDTARKEDYDAAHPKQQELELK